MRKEILAALLIFIILVLAEIFFITPHKAHYFWQKIPAFFGLLGLAGSVILMVTAKFIGKVFLYRKENYYKDFS